MMNMLRSVFMMPRRERAGFTALIILLIISITAYFMLPLFVYPPPRDKAADERLAAEWKTFNTAKSDEAEDGSQLHEAQAAMFVFDPNTLDSIGFQRLGLSAKAIKGLMNWRAHGKHFYKPEDLKPLYNLSAEDYNRLAPYISIAGMERKPFEHKEWSNNYPAILSEIDINTTDTTTLDRAIRGVGATIARKIIAKRNALGGFMKFEQITEGMRLPDSTVAALKEKVRINTAIVRRIKVNDATLLILASHPYIGEKLAKGILQLRDGYGGRYSNVEQLRQAPLMTEEIYRKIAPYLSIE